AAGGMPALRKHSIMLTGMLERLIEHRLGNDIEVITPSEPERRGCQLSLRLRSGHGRAVFESLQRVHIVCDWREPDVIRVAPTPLYNTADEIERFVGALAAILK